MELKYRLEDDSVFLNQSNYIQKTDCFKMIDAKSVSTPIDTG